MRETHRNHDNTPNRHDSRDENTRSQTLEQDIGQRFEERIRDEEDGQTGVVLAAGDVKRCLQTVEFRIADVGAVEEGDEVEETEPGDETQVELPEEFAVLSGAGQRAAYACWRWGGNTILARSSALRFASGSGGSSLWPRVSNSPGLTPTCLSLSTSCFS